MKLDDKRLANWTGFRKLSSGATVYFPYKYKVRTNTSGALTEYSMVMRLAEQFLIRAEARIQQDKLDDGRADLDSVRIRAGLLPLPVNLDKDALLLAVEQERKVELFVEWGHRWFDLKRTGRADASFETHQRRQLAGHGYAVSHSPGCEENKYSPGPKRRIQMMIQRSISTAIAIMAVMTVTAQKRLSIVPEFPERGQTVTITFDPRIPATGSD